MYWVTQPLSFSAIFVLVSKLNTETDFFVSGRPRHFKLRNFVTTSHRNLVYHFNRLRSLFIAVVIVVVTFL